MIKKYLGIVGLALILLIAIVVRLKDLQAPLADWHSWRQADTASVALEYTRPTLAPISALLTPTFHDLSNIPSGQENPNGYRMVEFPIINYLVAFLVTTIPGLDPTFDLVWMYRLVNALFSVATIAVVYCIVRILSKQKRVALLTALIMALMPYSIFYSRAILPEIALNFFSYAALLSFILWIKSYRLFLGQKRKTILHPHLMWLAVSWVFLATSFLLKPVAVFMAPAFVALAIWEFGIFGMVLQWPLWILATSIAPLIGWRLHMQQYSEGIPVNRWLFNENGIRLKPSWWRWLFGERIGYHMLGYWATGFAFVGLFASLKDKAAQKLGLFDWVSLALAAGWFGYLVVFATGNVQHDYYQIPLIPVLSLLVARGVIWLYDMFTHTYPRFLVAPALAFMLLLSTFLAWDHIRSYFGINNPAIVSAGKAIQTITPLDAKVIAPYMGDTAFLFQTRRSGWPIGFSIDERIAAGATHYVSTSYDDEARELEQRYTVIEKTDEYIIIDLTKPASQSASETEL